MPKIDDDEDDDEDQMNMMCFLHPKGSHTQLAPEGGEAINYDDDDDNNNGMMMMILMITMIKFTR